MQCTAQTVVLVITHNKDKRDTNNYSFMIIRIIIETDDGVFMIIMNMNIAWMNWDGKKW